MIITLCGSAKFEQAFHFWNEKLSMAGHVVISLAVLPSYKGSKDWYDENTKTILDEVHLKKIDASDAIFVIDQGTAGPETYIGYSTNREIKFACKNNKKIFYASEMNEHNRNNLGITRTSARDYMHF